MKVITMESSAFTALTEQIAEIAAHVRAVSGERKEKSADRLLTTREAAHLLNVSIRTLQRMRSADRIGYKIIYGRCYYDLHDIEEAIRNRSLYCNPKNMEELRHNFKLKSRKIKDGTIG